MSSVNGILSIDSDSYMRPVANQDANHPEPVVPHVESLDNRNVSVISPQQVVPGQQPGSGRPQNDVVGDGRSLNERQVRALRPFEGGGGVLSDFRALVNDLARPDFSNYRLEERAKRVLDAVPSDSAGADRIFRSLGRAVEGWSKNVDGRQALEQIISNQKFKDFHQALTSCLPALSKLKGEGNVFDHSLAKAKRLVKLMDSMVTCVGGKRPKALGLVDVSYQLRSTLVAVFPSLEDAVKTRLAQPTNRSLSCLGGHSDFPQGPNGVGDTKRVLLKCLDGYKTHEESFDPFDIHGRTHATRVFVFANVLGNILRELGAEVDVDAVAMMAAGHDVGREGNQQDVFEDKSANHTRRCIKETFGADPNAANDYVDSVADSIMTGADDAKTVEAYLLHCADSLDFWRVDDMDMNAFPFLRENVALTGQNGRPLVIKMSPKLREALARESCELTKLTHEIAAMDIERRQIENKDEQTEEDIQRYLELGRKQQIDSDWMHDVWQPRMARTNEEVINSVEKTIRDNPQKFSLLSRYYLAQTSREDALDVLRRGLVTKSGIASSYDVKAGLEGLRTQQEALVRAKRNEGLDELAALNASENSLFRQMKDYAAGLTNGDLTVMYESLQGKEITALRQRLGNADDTEGLGLLDDLESALVYEIACRVDLSIDSPEKLDAEKMGSLPVESMATLVDTTSQAVMMAEGAKKKYETNIRKVVSNPVDASVIGDILRERDLTVNFKPIYLFGDLRRENLPVYPIDTNDHKYKNLFHVQQMSPDRYIADLRLRQDVENLRFPKIGKDNVAGRVRPTYTALNGAGKLGGAREYGHSVIVLKPKCKKKATYTYGGIDYMMPVAIEPANEEKFVRELRKNAHRLCLRERSEQAYRNDAEKLKAVRERYADMLTANEFVAALDDPNSNVRQAISAFFTNEKHATDKAYRRLEYYETDAFSRTVDLEDWDELIRGLNIGVSSSDGELVACLVRSCTPPEGQVEKETDFEHIENLLQDMQDYDDVRMNLSIRRNKGERFVLDGAGFIEAKLHQEIDIYEDVEEIRFGAEDLPPEDSPFYARRVEELKAWGELHHIKITIITSQEVKDLTDEFENYGKQITDFVDQNVRNQRKPVRIDA